MEEQLFIEIGSSFHSLGAAQENAPSQWFVCVVGTVKRDVLVDPRTLYTLYNNNNNIKHLIQRHTSAFSAVRRRSKQSTIRHKK